MSLKFLRGVCTRLFGWEVAQQNATRVDESTYWIGELEAMRTRFRHHLVGVWSTPDLIPMGAVYQFNADGSGIYEERRGFGGQSFALHWRAMGDWKIEVMIEYPPDFWRQFHDEATDGPFEPIENEWETVAYDFAVQTVGYGPNIVLYSPGWGQDRLEFENCLAPLIWSQMA